MTYGIFNKKAPEMPKPVKGTEFIKLMPLTGLKRHVKKACSDDLPGIIGTFDEN